jgi:hypothetical protein
MASVAARAQHSVSYQHAKRANAFLWGDFTAYTPRSYCGAFLQLSLIPLRHGRAYRALIVIELYPQSTYYTLVPIKNSLCMHALFLRDAYARAHK